MSQSISDIANTFFSINLIFHYIIAFFISYFAGYLSNRAVVKRQRKKSPDVSESSSTNQPIGGSVSSSNTSVVTDQGKVIVNMNFYGQPPFPAQQAATTQQQPTVQVQNPQDETPEERE